MTASHIFSQPLDKLHAQSAALTALLGEAVVATEIHHNELTMTVQRDSILAVVRLLKEQDDYQQLVDITAVDYPARSASADGGRFELVYNLLSLTRNQRVRLKIRTDEDTPVASLAALFPSANWYEREVYDMYGVLFSDHPDLRRILTDYGFEGYPQRKDFPLTGYVETRYDPELRRVVYEPVTLQQDFRNFDFLSPWEGMTSVMLPGDEKATVPPVMPNADRHQPNPAEVKPTRFEIK